jgi:hypothetical protein
MFASKVQRPIYINYVRVKKCMMVSVERGTYEDAAALPAAFHFVRCSPLCSSLLAFALDETTILLTWLLIRQRTLCSSLLLAFAWDKINILLAMVICQRTQYPDFSRLSMPVYQSSLCFLCTRRKRPISASTRECATKDDAKHAYVHPSAAAKAEQ